MFALDTNLLIFQGPRRLLTGIALATNTSIVVLPQVQQELIEHRNIATAEVRRWARKFRQQGISNDERNTYIQALNPSIRDWFETQVLNNPPFVSHALDQEATFQVESLAEGIPIEAFNGPNTLADRLVIAQAVYFDVELLGSHDTRTIVHDDVNTWAYAKGYNRPLIRSPSELVFDLSENDLHTAYQWMMAFNSNRTDLPSDENNIEFLRTLNTVGRSGFDERNHLGLNTLIAKLKSHLECDESFQATFEEALQIYGGTREKVLSLENGLMKQVNTVLEPYEQ